MTRSKRVQCKRDLRRLLLLLHRYGGFIFAADLIVVCASGTALLLLENQISDYRDHLMLRVPIHRGKVLLAQNGSRRAQQAQDDVAFLGRLLRRRRPKPPSATQSMNLIEAS